jgi:peptidoglycan/LPS O-acetylase OafA/YrhL
LVAKNSEIQSLRGLAILAVIAFHAKEQFSPNGFIGVDVFFLISGYLIIPRAIDAVRTRTLQQFFARRFRRLAPATVFMLISMLPLVLVFGSWQSHKQYLLQAILTLLILGNVGAILISGDYFNPSSFMPLVHTWSLSVEEQFYLILPLILRAGHGLMRLLSVGSFILFVLQTPLGISDKPSTFYLIFTRIWEFHTGYLIWLRKTKMVDSSALGTFAMVLLIVLLFVPHESPLVVSTIGALGLTSIFILYGKLMPVFSKFLGIIGARAFSLYLFHMPFLYLAKFTPVFYSQDRKFHTVAGITLAVIFAEFSFRKIEFAFNKQVATG